MAPGSPRSSALAALAVALAALTSTPVSAHRLDEYLQAARIAIDPGRVQIELDLTPGIAVAPRVLADIDRDGNRAITADETRAYATRVLSEIRVGIDGQLVALELDDTSAAAVDALSRGEGAIRLHLRATVPPLRPGKHQLFYRNNHHADIGVYLANALVPSSDRVGVLQQRRDVDQQQLIVEYALDAVPAPGRLPFWWVIAAAGATLACLALTIRVVRSR
jgi:hypothetical protein